MSLIFTDGFEDQLLALKWNQQVTSVQIQPGNGRNGSTSINISGNSTGILRRRLPAADTHATMILGQAWKGSNATTSFASATIAGRWGTIATFSSDDGATNHISVSFETQNSLVVRRGDQAGTVLASIAIVPQGGVWYYIEVLATIDDTAGVVQVRLNGTQVINFTGDTRNGGTSPLIDEIKMYGAQGAGSDIQKDDIYLCNGAGTVNNTFLGDVTIETLYPNGNGTASEWVGSDGNSTDNYLLVDEPGAVVLTDYTGSSTVGARDLYALANLARVDGSIKGAIVTSNAVNQDSGARSMRNVIKSGATVNAAAASTPVVTTPTMISSTYEVDPNTGNAWTVAAINAMEIGVEVSA